MAESLLTNCPQVTILATSREALGAWEKPGHCRHSPSTKISLNISNINQSEAVSLFAKPP
jgi:predicted ATPase